MLKLKLLMLPAGCASVPVWLLRKHTPGLLYLLVPAWCPS
uniref:Uncharacterized protein n=2 Tax=Anguilla anguilla TaxID=7936 RepID=A0A0E9V323_ANGAN